MFFSEMWAHKNIKTHAACVQSVQYLKEDHYEPDLSKPLVHRELCMQFIKQQPEDQCTCRLRSTLPLRVIN